MSRSIYGGMEWAFTSFGKSQLIKLWQEGFEYDLAVTYLHDLVEQGVFSEAEIYEDPENA